MSISRKIRALLAISGKKQVDLAQYFGMTRQVMNNKLSRESWSAADLIKVADFCDCKIAFICPDGQRIYLSLDDGSEQQKSPDT